MNIEKDFKKKLKEISDILDDKTFENKEVGVLSGVSGIALFQFYYAKFLDDDTHADKGADIITKAVELINEGFTYPTFCTGIAGACWVLEILKEEEFVELEDDFLSSDLDEYLLSAMRADIETENFDFLHGAMGYGFYFLKRYQNTTSLVLKEGYKEYLDELINAFKKTAKKNDRGVWWESILKKEDNLKGCNLSLSHGISSTINFLSRIAEHEEFYDDVNEVLTQTVKFILSYKNRDIAESSQFPSWIVEEKENNVNYYSRLAWCYGDLGVGISLLHAGEALKDEELKNEAIAILKHSTKRRDIKEAGVMDAGLCHGAYGILHIYNYLYRKTKEIIFKETADHWAEQALIMGTHEKGYAGYMVWRGSDEEKWKNEESLLEGIAGIGLSIISYLAPFDTKWDECLLIS
ncbi:lanthionine synthetase C family protein [Aquimarina algiphila]|uniref:lanthionine synthetase C family protein n=1 Tax=Aquimarina algiphila TaxID=2047982 RepID=UPI00232E6A69|nr:lanthionine synthetase C family protein [Aquimarina algiphila]